MTNVGDLRNMQTLILAGGLGTRLREHVSDRPKPMADVLGKPFLEYIIELLREAGIQQIVLCVGYRADQIQAYFKDGSHWGVKIAYAVEKELQGTAGAIKNARHWIDGSFIVLNGDSFQEINLPAMAVFHKEHRRKDAALIGTIATRFIAECSPYGSLRLDNQNILGFQEKGLHGPGWINAGVYILEPEILNLIPNNQATSIEKQTFPLALEQQWNLSAFPTSGFFVDIGTPIGYATFGKYIKNREL